MTVLLFGLFRLTKAARTSSFTQISVLLRSRSSVTRLRQIIVSQWTMSGGSEPCVATAAEVTSFRWIEKEHCAKHPSVTGSRFRLIILYCNSITCKYPIRDYIKCPRRIFSFPLLLPLSLIDLSNINQTYTITLNLPAAINKLFSGDDIYLHSNQAYRAHLRSCVY